MDTWKLYFAKLVSFLNAFNACFGAISIAAAAAAAAAADGNDDASTKATQPPPTITLGRVREVATGIYTAPIPHMSRLKAFLYSFHDLIYH